MLFLCGLHPYTPDMLIDVDIADGRVWIRYAEFFSRPLRLTASEGLALLAAGNAVLSGPGADADGPLARGLAKLASILGLDTDQTVDVSLGSVPGRALQMLTDAAAAHRQVDIEYYAFGRDEWSWRVVDPYAVFSAAGQWYLSAYCHKVDDERLFRVDRVREARLLDERFEPPEVQPELSLFRPRADDPRVTLELDAGARWVAEQYPVEKVTHVGEGQTRVTLAVSERAWLERLLLRLGPSARVVEGDSTVGQIAARRLLGRYDPTI
jgi:proteasome accessory factor C